MPDLALSPTAEEDLRKLLRFVQEAEPSSSERSASSSTAADDAPQGPRILPAAVAKALQDALDAPKPLEHADSKNGKMSGSSPAVPAEVPDSTPTGAQLRRTHAVVVHHDVLMDTAEALRACMRRTGGDELLATAGIDWTKYTLNSVIKGAALYFPPKPKFIRSAELEESLARIRAQQEADSYAAMTTTQSSSSSAETKLLKGYTFKDAGSVSSPGPSYLPNTSTSVVPTERGVNALSPEAEAREWAQIRKAISAIINVLVSMFGVATAVYLAAGSSAALTVPYRTILALLGALVVGGAEGFLYVRSFSQADEKNKLKDLKGSKEKKSKYLDADTLRRMQEEQMLQWKTSSAAADEKEKEPPDAPAGASSQTKPKEKLRQRRKGK